MKINKKHEDTNKHINLNEKHKETKHMFQDIRKAFKTINNHTCLTNHKKYMKNYENEQKLIGTLDMYWKIMKVTTYKQNQ